MTIQESTSRVPALVLLSAVLVTVSAGGCGSCVSFEATYDEAWEATRTAILAQPEMRSVNPVERYDAGTFEAEVPRPAMHDELHYRVEITPAGGEDRVKRKLCVWVQEVEGPPVSATVGDQVGEMKTRRRRDLEASITEIVDRALAVPEADQEDQ